MQKNGSITFQSTSSNTPNKKMSGPTRNSGFGRGPPIGIRLFQKILPNISMVTKNIWYRGVVLLLTFWAYVNYHATRKTLSVVKNTLLQNCTDRSSLDGNSVCAWKPFDGPDAKALLGTLDSAFLFSYAFFMFISGMIAEHVNLRYYISLGMIMSGISTYMFGLGKVYNIHVMWYFLAVQVFGGIAQTTGWPGVVTVMGHWFGKAKRGVIFGIWNSHTSVGNIMGAVIASHYTSTDWSLSFIVPGIIIAVSGVVIFLFLPEYPGDVGCTSPKKVNQGQGATNMMKASQPSEKEIKSEGSPILLHTENIEKPAIGFMGALRIPGVLEFSFCLFFAKLVSYTFLYWLPGYVKYSTSLSDSMSGDLATAFDVGGIFGGIAAGLVSDMTGKSASICVVMLVLSIPMLFIYQALASASVVTNMLLLLVVGGLVNGPYALITTAVSAELGTHECLDGNSKALATVTSIIDGTGSIGAAVGPLLAGFVSAYGWMYVFYMLMFSCSCAVLLLVRLLIHECKSVKKRPTPNDVATRSL